MIAGEKAAVDSKEKIRARYRGVDPSELEVIPAIATDEIALDQRKLKVAAYVRVSTENDEQTSSYELQVNDFTDRINANPNWEFAGIYSDEGISGTELSHRKGMLQMIEDARAGKIDHTQVFTSVCSEAPPASYAERYRRRNPLWLCSGR